MTPTQFQQHLLSWFDTHGRKDLPWQQAITPYRVWVSEIMLQQTLVASVIPYFNRFIARFPDVHALAAAEVDEVLQYWSGLGYYARARNLHKTAQLIAGHGGEFPQTPAALSGLPGIGLSTAGAILSIACGQSQPILDGNVRRVLARFCAVTGWPGERRIAEQLWALSRMYTPVLRAAAYTQAIMDLGATLCVRSKPDCRRCPVAAGCQALAQNLVDALPQPRPRKTLPVRQLFFLVLDDGGGRLLLQKRPPTGIWGGLWSFPEFGGLEDLQAWCRQQRAEVVIRATLPVRRHSFTHYHLDYTPVLAELKNPMHNVMEADAYLWYKAAATAGPGLPTPVKNLCRQLYPQDLADSDHGLKQPSIDPEE